MIGLAIDQQLWERVSRKHVHISLNVKILWVLKRTQKKKKIEKRKRKIDNHTQERMPRIYVVWPLAYIHGRRQRESSTNKYEKYKGGVIEFSQNSNPNTPKLLNIKEILSYYSYNIKKAVVLKFRIDNCCSACKELMKSIRKS